MIEKVSCEMPSGRAVATRDPSRLIRATASAFVTVRQVPGHVLREDHPLAEEEAVARVRHDALVQFPDRIELLLGDLHGARHWAARTWGRTIKLPRWLFPWLHRAGRSAAATLRA